MAIMRSEKMAQVTLDRAYQLRVTPEKERVRVEVLYPRTKKAARPVVVHRVMNTDFVRMVTALRGRYKVPSENVVYVDFSDERLQALLGKIPVDVKRESSDAEAQLS